MSTDDSVQSCRDGDAREYLEKHRIVELLNNVEMCRYYGW
jgi:hypothetical protein